MYVTDVSVFWDEDVIKRSPSIISKLNKKACVHIEDRQNFPLKSKKRHCVLLISIGAAKPW